MEHHHPSIVGATVTTNTTATTITTRSSSSPTISAFKSGKESPNSGDSDSVFSPNYNNKSPYLFSSDHSSILTKGTLKPYPFDLTASSALRPSSLSLSTFVKHNVGVKISEPIDPTKEVSDIDSLNLSREEEMEEEERMRGADDDLIMCEDFPASSPSLPSSARLRSCDVYIGLHGSKPALTKFVKWLRAELELQGVSCFAADRSRCKDAVSHTIVERAMNSATFGVVIVTEKSFSNPYSMYELRSFLNKKNLVPIFFGSSPGDCMVEDITGRRGELWEKHGGELWNAYGGMEDEWKEVVNALSRMEGWKLEAQSSNWRNCINEAVLLLGTRLGKRSMVERVKRWKERVEKEEFPFVRSERFVGRKKELLELELMLFGDIGDNGQNGCFEIESIHRRRSLKDKRNRSKKIANENTSKGKEPAVWKQSEEEIEMEGSGSLERWLMRGNHGEKQKRKTFRKIAYGKGVACVSGESGIGKTELLLEFCYRFAQRYRMVLWIGGEARYIRQNYMNLLSLLEVDVSIENQLCLESDRPRSFEELEEEAIRRVRKEFMRDIPFLIVIDNLEREKDWWDARNIMELLPRFGGESHILISTRLPRVMNLEPLKLSYLSGTESMSLMRGSMENLPMGEIATLRIIEEKLGRLTFGLALTGAILSEFQIRPHDFLALINNMPYKDEPWIGGEDQVLRRNPFLMHLIEVSFFIVNRVDKAASGMALASGWFAPAPVPISLLSLASSEALEVHGSKLWKKFLSVLTCRCLVPHARRLVVESPTILVRLGFARMPTKPGYIHFHDIIKLYSRKKGGTLAAYAMVRALNSIGSLPQHSEHIWAACFLLLKFGTNPAMLKPKVSELVSFINRLALPLAIHTFTNVSRCIAALELLRQCTEALEVIEESILSQMGNDLEKSLHSRITPSSIQLSPSLYRELVLLKATLLETRAKIMMQSGEYDIGEQLCRTAIRIRDVLYGGEFPERVSSSNTMDELLKSEASKRGN